MKTKEVRSLLLGALTPAFDELGFKYSRRHESFCRSTSFGRQAVFVPLWNYPGMYFETAIGATIRHDQTEAIFNRFSGVAEEYHQDTYSLIVQRSFFNNSPSRYRVLDGAPIEPAVSSLTDILHNHLVDFFERHQTIQSIDGLVNDDPTGTGERQPARAMHSVIIAKLARNPRFVELVVSFQRELDITSDSAHVFNDLVGHLESGEFS